MDPNLDAGASRSSDGVCPNDRYSATPTDIGYEDSSGYKNRRCRDELARPPRKMKFHATLCPGCCIACGLYMDEVGGRIFHRKRAPQNEGKLCPFGMFLPQFYSRPEAESRVGGKKVELQEALEAAKKKIEEYGKEVLFVAGRATNEEMASLVSLAEKLGASASSWSPSPSVNSFNDLENAGKLSVAFLDTFISYPLIARRILKAIEKGAKVKEISWVRSGKINSELVEPTSAEPDGLVIADLNPFTASISSMRGILFKPSVNSDGAFALGLRPSEKKGKAVFAIEPSPVEEAMLGDLKPETLIVQSAYQSDWTEKADIVLKSDRFFEKEGSILNVEGRTLPMHGSSRKGVGILSSIGGSNYEDARKRVLNSLGIESISEDRTLKIDGSWEKKGEFRIRGSGDKTLFTKTNPFFWSGIGHRDFIEININTVRELGIKRGEKVQVDDGASKKEFYFKISDVPDGFAVSEIRATQEPGVLTKVSLRKGGAQ